MAYKNKKSAQTAVTIGLIVIFVLFMAIALPVALYFCTPANSICG